MYRTLYRCTRVASINIQKVSNIIPVSATQQQKAFFQNQHKSYISIATMTKPQGTDSGTAAESVTTTANAAIPLHYSTSAKPTETETEKTESMTKEQAEKVMHEYPHSHPSVEDTPMYHQSSHVSEANHL